MYTNYLSLISFLLIFYSEQSSSLAVPHSTDVVIIGAGIGGLTAAAILTSKFNLKVDVFESHYHIGGCAHSFEITSKEESKTKYRFDAGPTILLGCSSAPYNPLQQILNYLDASSAVDWISYKSWGMVTEEGKWNFELGEKAFIDGPLLRFGGPDAVVEFNQLRCACLPLIEGSVGIPSPALRGDALKLIPLLRHMNALQKVIPYGDVLEGNFKPFMDKYVKNSWLRNWLDALAFSLSGLPAAETGAAAMAYTLFDLHRDGSSLDYPRGGMGEISSAVENIITSSGGRVHLSSAVASIGVENNRASGVTLKNGLVVQARKAVICNANIWALPRLLSSSRAKLSAEQSKFFIEESAAKLKTKSFLHLHLGLSSKGLNLKGMQPHFTVMNQGLEHPCADRNMVAVSNPSVLDESLTDRQERMIVHAYGAGNEPYEPWASMDRKSGEYKAAKTGAAEYLFESVSRALEIPLAEVKERAEVTLIGTPLTHQRYLLRDDGTYGSAWGSILKGPLTPLPGLLLCGDRYIFLGSQIYRILKAASYLICSVFPGIGVPAVALSGSCAANTVVNVLQHTIELIKAGV